MGGSQLAAKVHGEHEPPYTGNGSLHGSEPQQAPGAEPQARGQGEAP